MEIRGNRGNLKSAVEGQKAKMGDKRSKEARKKGSKEEEIEKPIWETQKRKFSAVSSQYVI